MGKAIKPTLAEVLISPNKEQYRAFILESLQANPYSQPLQRLALLLNEPSEHPIQRYDWHEKLNTSKPNENSPMISIGTVELNKKPKTSKIQKAQLNRPPKTRGILMEEKATELSPFTQWILANTSALSDDAVELQSADNINTVEQLISTTQIPDSNKDKKKGKKKRKKSKSKKGKASTGKTKKGHKKTKKKSKLKEKIDSSIQKNEEIATETLAKLYFEQGYYRKALAMYEKLSLIYPQKSSFFAPFIADIKIKLK